MRNKAVLIGIFFSIILMMGDSKAQNIEYPTIDSVKVIPEIPFKYVDQIKAIVYSKHKRTNCELDSTYFEFSSLDYEIYLRVNYSTSATNNPCLRTDTVPLVGLHAGQHTLSVYAKTYSDIDVLLDTVLIPFTVYDNLGLSDENNFQNLKLYPNPTRNLLNFKFKDNSKYLNLEISDVTGKIIKTAQFSNQNSGEFKQSIDISELKNGIYFCRFSNGKSEIIKKFIKK